MLEMLCDQSLKKIVFIILVVVVVVHSAEQIFLLHCLQKNRLLHLHLFKATYSIFRL